MASRNSGVLHHLTYQRQLNDHELAHAAVMRVKRDGLSEHTVECEHCHGTFDSEWMVVRWHGRLLCAWCIRDSTK